MVARGMFKFVRNFFYKLKKKNIKNNEVNINIVLENTELIPLRQTEGSAAYDIRAKVSDGFFPLLPYVPTLFKCGFKMEIPHGYHAKISLRSSIGKSGIIMPNSPGIIDSDYRGDISVVLLNLNNQIVNIRHGERIAQMTIEKNIETNWILVEKLTPTARGEKGFGSTGRGV